MTALAPHSSMDTITITYADRVAASAAARRFWLSADIEALPAGDPVKRVVAFMAAFAGAVVRGELPGPYTAERARTFARLALVDVDVYEAHRDLDDRDLADVLQLPPAEIPGVRRDQDRELGSEAHEARSGSRRAPAR